MLRVFQKIRKRRMVQWTIAYLAFAWLIVQVTEVLAGIFYWPGWLLQGLVWLLGFGLLALLVLAWYHGEKGEQRVSRPEVFALAGILVAAGIFFRSYEFSGPADDNADDTNTQSPFASLSTRRITAGRGYDGQPAWSPDGRSIVFVSERGGNADLWVRGPTGQNTQLTFDSAEDGQPAWSPDGRHILFVSSRGHGESLDRSVFLGYSLGGGVWKVAAFGGTPEPLIDGAFDPAWAPDGRQFAFDASFDGPRRIWVAAADGSDRRVVSQDDSDLTAHINPAWSPDGQWIVYERQAGSQSSSSELWLVSATGGPGKRLTAGNGRNFGPAWASPDSIVFASDQGGAINLWQLDIDPDSGAAVGQPVQVTLGAGEDIDPTVSVDGALAYTSLQRWRNIWSIGVDAERWALTGEMRPVFDSDWNTFAPALSADSSQLAYDSDQDGEVDVWKRGPAASEPTRLTGGQGQKLQPVWSPDGRLIAYFSNQKGNNDIWVVPAAGGEPVQLTHSPANDINPYWSPDGKEIAFVSDRGGQSEVWVMRADGSNARVLTENGVTGHTARWSPDGQWIMYTSMAAGDRDIWVVSTDGSQVRRLTETPTQDAHGLWSPDGAHFLYLADHREVWVQPFAGGAAQRLFAPGERIDYTHLAADGSELYFTRDRVEGDLWLMQ